MGGGWGVGGGGRWVGGGGYPPLPTHPPLRFTREQTRVEYIRRCRLMMDLEHGTTAFTVENLNRALLLFVTQR